MKYIAANSWRRGRFEWVSQDDLFGDMSGVVISFPTGREPEPWARRVLASRVAQEGEHWLRPVDTASAEGPWLIDLGLLRDRFPEFLKDLDWLSGRKQLNPVFDLDRRINDKGDILESGALLFQILKEELKPIYGAVVPPELAPYMGRFRADHPDPSRCVFLMMRFAETPLHDEIAEAVEGFCRGRGLEALRADGTWYSLDLWQNVRTYMHGCDWGIAVLEQLTASEFNPNVSLEVGYMMAQGKPVCLLKDSTLASLQTDLMGRLYEAFDPRDASATIPAALDRWVRNVRGA